MRRLPVTPTSYSKAVMSTNARYAADLARGAGSVLAALQRRSVSRGSDFDALKARADAAAQRYLDERIRRERPGDAVLSEEGADSLERLSAHRVWIIDPLDGTREFAEGRDDWAVHVALWEDGDLVAGAVALPGVGLVLTSEDEPRVFAPPKKIRLAVSRSRPPALVDYLAVALDAELVPMGSAGFKTGAVVSGAADAYVHDGGQYDWDSAGPVAVARRAGLFTSRVSGRKLDYNQPDPYLPDLVVCNPAIAESLLEAADRFRRRETIDVGR